MARISDAGEPLIQPNSQPRTPSSSAAASRGPGLDHDVGDRADDRPPQRRRAAEHHHEHEDDAADQREEAEIGVDELAADGEQRPADGAHRRRHPEHQRLGPRRVDAHDRGGRLVVADRDQRPADPALHDAPADEVGEREHDDRDPPHEHETALLASQLAEDRPRRDVVVAEVVDAAGAIGEPLRHLPLDELREQDGQTERDECQVHALQAQRRQRGRAPDDEPGDRRRRRTSSPGSSRSGRRARPSRSHRARSTRSGRGRSSRRSPSRG